MTHGWITVAEAATHTGKSKRLIYNLIDERLIRTQDSTDATLVNLAELRKVLANRRGPGRPRRDTPAA